MNGTTINLLSRISSMQAKIPSKSLLFVILAFISTSFLRLLYIFTYPLSYIGDSSVYYSMILKQKSHLLQASGYPWLIMKPYHFLKNWVLHRSELPSNPNWWEPYDRWQTPIKGVFSWTEVFQDHPFILFQHCIEISSIILGYCLIKKYFGRIIGALFVFFYALSPLSLEGPSTTFPEWFQAVFVIYWFFFAEKASQVTGSKKYCLYTLLGGITACGVLIKFNSLPLFIMLFLGLLLIGNWKKSIRPCLFSIGAFSVIIFYFLFSFHIPTTGTASFTMNSWVLATKAFGFIPSINIRPENGISAKRILALLDVLPKEDGPGPASYFNHMNEAAPVREYYREKYLSILHENEEALDERLSKTSIPFTDSQHTMLRIAYFIGLKEYKSLLTNFYLESIYRYPWHFINHTVNMTLASFYKQEDPKFYGQTKLPFKAMYSDVVEGKVELERNTFGFTEFQWPLNPVGYAFYRSNTVWLPGVWLFSELDRIWPTLWISWAFTFIAAFFAVSNLSNRKTLLQSKIILGLFLILLCFVGYSNLLWVSCRIKDYRCIHMIMIGLSAIGFWQTIERLLFYARRLRFQYKMKKEFQWTKRMN